MERPTLIVLGVLAFAVGICLLPIGAVQLMAEGPHGPGGRITGDPGGPDRLRAIVDVAFVLFLAGAQLFNRARS
jgi:hypothetical protein